MAATTVESRATVVGALDFGACRLSEVGARIFIVDTDAGSALWLEALLVSAGYRDVTVVTSPGWAPHSSVDSEPDLVVLALAGPNAEGFSVLSSIKRLEQPDGFVPVVAVAGDGQEHTKKKALSGGANDVLVRPFDAEELLLRIANLLEARRRHVRLERRWAAAAADLQVQHDAQRSADADHAERLRRIAGQLAKPEQVMVFQPIADLNSGRVVAAEALARFGNGAAPDRWFAEAALVGLAVELEVRAVMAAIAHLSRLPAEVDLAINVSPAVALSAELNDALETVAADRVIIELTEHAKVTDYEVLSAALDRHRSRGTRIAVDDAGAGFATLQHIVHLRPDIIKLDLSLTRGIDADPVRQALTSSLRAFADEVGAALTAEGIETHAELEALRSLDVRVGQGFYLGRPGALPLPRVALRRYAQTRRDG